MTTFELTSRAAEFRLRAAAVKLQAGCADCGFRGHPRALDFDHVRGVKVSGVAQLCLTAATWEDVEAEIAKCEVVCSTCHRVRTAHRAEATRAVRDSHPARSAWEARVARSGRSTARVPAAKPAPVAKPVQGIPEVVTRVELNESSSNDVVNKAFDDLLRRMVLIDGRTDVTVSELVDHFPYRSRNTIARRLAAMCDAEVAAPDGIGVACTDRSTRFLLSVNPRRGRETATDCDEQGAVYTALHAEPVFPKGRRSIAWSARVRTVDQKRSRLARNGAGARFDAA